MKASFEQRKAVGFVKACLAVYFFRLRYRSREEHADLARTYVREARKLGWRGRVSEKKKRPAEDGYKPTPKAEDTTACTCKVIPFMSREEKDKAEQRKRIVRTILEFADKLDW